MAPLKQGRRGVRGVKGEYGGVKDKYAEESVRLLRFWEFTIKKMVDYRNHRISCLGA